MKTSQRSCDRTHGVMRPSLLKRPMILCPEEYLEFQTRTIHLTFWCGRCAAKFSTMSTNLSDSCCALQREQIGVEINENKIVSPELPDVLRRRFRVYFKPGTKIAVRTVRSIRAADIGHLVTFTVWFNHASYYDFGTYFGLQGVCTRVGDVKPLLEVACLTCDCCGFEIYQV